MKNGSVWLDNNGVEIQAHGGMILEFKDSWYWYGEHKGRENCEGTTRVDVIGISCYSSKDLMNWNYEGLALEADTNNPESMIAPDKVCDRPKVIYNEKNKQFVMWVHIDTANYAWAGVGIAVSDTPIGPFTLLKTKQPNRQDCRDMTLFQDVDGTAYLVHSTNWNKSLNIARLNSDYTDTDGFYVTVLVDQEREAPALFYKNGMYYMVTSGCTGWNPNAALYATSEHLLGKWKLIDNPCEGKDYHKTFFGQSTYVLNYQGSPYLMLDHWKPRDLRNSGYSILPITFETGDMVIRWSDEFAV